MNPSKCKSIRKELRAAKQTSLFPMAGDCYGQEPINDFNNPFLETEAKALEEHHHWPAGMTPPSEWSYRNKELFDTVAHWVMRAGHTFSYEQVGEFETKNVSYLIGTMEIDGKKSKYWLRYECYAGGQMSVEGYGSFYSSDTDEFPELCIGGISHIEESFNATTGLWITNVHRKPEGVAITQASYPVAYEVLKVQEELGYSYPFSRSDPRILYKHPETGELLKWPEWKKVQAKHFKIITPSDVTRVPHFLLQRQMSRLLERTDEPSIMADMQELDKLIKLSEELDAAREKWARVEMQLTDGYPLCWVYSGTSSVDATDLLNLLEDNGLEFDVSES